jgi:2'-hydroxyisoflavone reductase
VSTSRRSFLRTAGAGAGAALGLGLLPGTARGGFPTPSAEPLRPPVARADRALRILILGGTGFIGPHQVWYAVERGHEVTIFNRGNRTPDLPEGIEWLTGDRNDDLSALEGRDWDVVIDNPTTLPKWVRDSASLLQNHAGQYIFISTISVYASEDAVWADESDALASFDGDDPYAVTQVTGATYGPLKALSEQEAERWFPGRTTIVRPGLIVGPGDPTDRFTYWPVRVARGGEILAPPAADPVQVIDARDLSEWVIRMAEQGDTGTFNATGPRSPLSVAGMLWACWAATGTEVSFRHADADFLAEHGVRPWSDMPVWVPDSPQTAGFSRRSIQAALDHGLTFRPMAETVADTLAWHATRPEEARGPQLRAGLAPEREAELLAAYTP